MTIETITDLIHEYMYDRLNDSNNSNDGRNVKHVQERPQKRKWSEKSSYERNKRRPEYQKQKYKDNRCGQCGAPNWSRQHVCPARTVECRNCKKKGHYEKMCRLPKRIQYVDKISSSAEEDNWDYNKIQSINNKKKKEDFFHATLLVNDVPIKFIIDSGSPVTLIPQKLFKGTSEVTKLNTNYKDVNDKIEFRGQTLATVKTNNTTLQLPLLITKANITPLMGLDWMNRLGIALNTTTEDVKIHNIKLDETQKKILKLKNEFKDLFYNNTEIKNLSVKINLKADAKIIQQRFFSIEVSSFDLEQKQSVLRAWRATLGPFSAQCHLPKNFLYILKKIKKMFRIFLGNFCFFRLSVRKTLCRKLFSVFFYFVK